MTNPKKFATIAGVFGAAAIGGFVFANRESNTSTFERALNRFSGKWTGTAQLFLPNGKSAVLNGTLKCDGKAREYRFVADFRAGADTQKLISSEGQNSNMNFTKFFRLTPYGTFTLDETPIEYDDLAAFASGKSQSLRSVSKTTQYVEIVELRNSGSSLEISVATGKDNASVKPNMVFRMSKVRA